MTERVAIVGAGLGGFVAYVTLRHTAGLEPAEIAVFGDDPDPVAAWLPRAAAIRQRQMRSESDGHGCPTSFPGLRGARGGPPARSRPAAAQRLRPLPADASRSSSATSTSCESAAAGTRASGAARIERVLAVDDGFELDGHGVFRHVLLAPGHPGLAGRPSWRGDPRVVHAYEPHDYAARVAVIGAGMAAATEWLNALEAGAEVVSVRRREPARRPLNVARPLFSKRGLAAFHADVLRGGRSCCASLGEPSYPPGRALGRAARAQRRARAASASRRS